MIRIAGNTSKRPPLVMTIVDDPVQCAEHARIREIFNRNFDWYQAHSDEFASVPIGHCIFIAGTSACIAPTFDEALAMARDTHPEEDGGYYFFYVRPVRDATIPRKLHVDFGAMD
jgi:hypothetical protein